MFDPVKFELISQDQNARLGRVRTIHGEFDTPVFMPVGTLATVKTLSPHELESLGAKIILGNTYHLALRPGIEVFRKFGGIHPFMKWTGSVLTDSGGFQIFSLPHSRKISEDAAVFRSYVNGDLIVLSPEKCMEIQNAIGSDIMMVLDQCIESTADFAATKKAMELTHRWALRSKNAHQNKSTQGLFSIVQGGLFPELRKQSADFLTQHEFSGFAIGGLAVGEEKHQREDMTQFSCELLPKDRPRYLMGVGTPLDLLEAVYRGVDMFDCIIPTKLAQQGIIFTWDGTDNLSKAHHKLSDEVISPNCQCTTCLTYSRGYVHHLIKSHEVLGWRLLSYHNIYFYLNLMSEIRKAIASKTYGEFYRKFKNRWEAQLLEIKESREQSVLRRPRKQPPMTFTPDSFELP